MERICIDCGRPFESPVNSDTCPSCLIKPSKSDFKIPDCQPKKKESLMPGAITTKPRECLYVFPGEENKKCGKQFIPRGNRQLFCEEHLTKKSRSKQLPRPEKISKKNENPAGEKPSMDCLLDGKIIEVLIAAGYITREKVNKARCMLK
jgi:hypothetical protein